MPINSRAKGSAFERLVAKQILGAVSAAGITTVPADVYRTPLSGGHVFASQTDPGDLQFSAKLKEILPLCVECKHYRKLDLSRYLLTPKSSWNEWQWMAQVVKAAKAQPGTMPVLIMRGNHTEIFCAFRLPSPGQALCGVASRLIGSPHMSIYDATEKRMWCLTTLDKFLAAVTYVLKMGLV